MDTSDVAFLPFPDVAAEYNNYPVCFFDNNTNQWHGIYFDALDEVTKFTGLRFQRVNDRKLHNHDLTAMLERGIASSRTRADDLRDRTESNKRKQSNFG